MQELFAQLLWENEEIPEKAAQLCERLPGFDAAQQEYDEALQKIQDLVGYQLCDQFCQRLYRYTSYEVRAYYALGLGLQEALLRELGM